MKRLLILIPLLFLAIIGAVIARLNAASVTFDFYFSSIEVPLAILLYGALILGTLLGLLLSLFFALKVKREKARLRRRLALSEQEIKNLREIPIKGQY